MHWILQENLFKETEWEDLVTALERFDIPYSVHKVVPFVGELIPAPEPKQDKVICFGSYSMRHAAREFGWKPGVYDLFDMNFNEQMKHWGNNMLNADSVVIPFKDAYITKPTFIRPIDDSKYFAGKVFEPEDFNDWVHKVCVLKEDFGTSLTGDTLIQLNKPKTIFAEYRYWIVNGKIVTRSLYKRGSRVVYSSDADRRFDLFVSGMTGDPSFALDAWQPHRAFVFDVCDTPEGIKIVEINTINSAGFYAGNVQEIVMALEAMEN